MQLDKVIKDNDFLIDIRPVMDDKGWAGKVDIFCITSEKNDMNDKDFDEMVMLSKMVSASVPLMDIDEDFRDYIMDYVEGTMEEEIPVNRVAVEHDGNVIKVDFTGEAL